MTPFGQCTAADIANEARNISKLCVPGSDENIVWVLRHGWLSKDRYFIDMEYCSITLADKIETVQSPFNHLSGISSEKPRMEITEAIDILLNICAGLVYLHKNHHVHRDLKPRNGNF
jgi:serine/threonine protein kinase